MSIFNLFKKKQLDIGNITLFFDFANANVVHSDNISKEVHTRKKFYHEIFCSKANSDMIKPAFVSIYVSVSYTGTNMQPLAENVEKRIMDYKFGRYPLFYCSEEVFSIKLNDVLKSLVDIHAEIDHKDGESSTKYIFHCYDNENNFDVYLVFYDTSVDEEVKRYLLNPEWIK